MIETQQGAKIAFKIDPGDKTHFGRGYGERLWDEIGVNINQNQHDTQQNSYVTSLPRKAILGASGHDPEDPERIRFSS